MSQPEPHPDCWTEEIQIRWSEVRFFRRREDRRSRYDDGFRREALALIKAGAGRDALARRLAMPRWTAEKWVMLYRSGGEEAVMGGGGRRYDWETKVAAAHDHVENGMTKTEAMARHGIASIVDWQRCVGWFLRGQVPVR